MTIAPLLAAPAAPTGRARLVRYLPYLFRDYLFQSGAAFLIFAFFLAGFPLAAESYGKPDGWIRSADGQATASAVFRSVATNILFFGTLMSANAVVSNDRKQGYFRFLFAKPLSVVRYYLVAWGSRGVAYVLLVAALAAAWDLLAAPLAVGGAAMAAALYFVAIGSLGFLLSTVVRQDWLFTAIAWTAAQLGTAWVEARQWTGVPRRAADLLLPPVDALGDAVGALLAGAEAPSGAVTHVLLFGLACVLLAVLLLRRRPLSP